MFWAKNKKKKKNHNVGKISILHGRVFVMKMQGRVQDFVVDGSNLIYSILLSKISQWKRNDLSHGSGGLGGGGLTPPLNPPLKCINI